MRQMVSRACRDGVCRCAVSRNHPANQQNSHGSDRVQFAPKGKTRCPTAPWSRFPTGHEGAGL